MKKTFPRRYMLIVFGPTGVGKTDCVLELAQHIPSEVINMDMGQFYRPLTIGTAKPDWRNEPTPHHLFDIVDEPRNFTVAEYRALVRETLEKIWKKNKLAILVGGSGFYLKSLFFPPRIGGGEGKVDYPADSELWSLLQTIDPERAVQINKQDTYRIKRALDIWYATGKKPSTLVPEYKPIASSIIINLVREQQELYERINTRVIQMIDQGWLDEVAKLHGTVWEPFVREKKIIGYPELLDYLEGEKTGDRLQKTIQMIQKRTRNYAKRQRTFWRMLERDLVQAQSVSDNILLHMESVNLTFVDLHLYINQLQGQLAELMK